MPEVSHENYQTEHDGEKLLGAKEKKPDRRNVMMTAVVDTAKIVTPSMYDWDSRYKKSFQPYHNQKYGSCTISSQAEACRLWERREMFGRDLFIPEKVIEERYFDLTQRLYGGGDQGAYELDALNDFRINGFKVGGRTYKIDMFTEVPIDKELLKTGIYVFRGVKICYAITQTMYNAGPDDIVDDDNSSVIGYHSMFTHGYVEKGVWMTHTWNRKPQLFTWNYVLNRATEAYTCVDAKDIRVKQLVGEDNLKKLKMAVKEAIDAPVSEA